MKYLLGYDLGSSSIKAALLDVASGRCVASATSPGGGQELGIAVPRPGWAEQHPARWWQEVVPQAPKNGVLLCLNGTGLGNSWVRWLLGELPYEQLTQLAAPAPVGAAGRRFLPFGNGAARILENQPSAAGLHGLHFNEHGRAHVSRAVQEGIVYALTYGMDLMRQLGVQVRRVRAGRANMFLSPVFREAFVNAGDLTLEFYDTDAAQGAARGAGIYPDVLRAQKALGSGFAETYTPNPDRVADYAARYAQYQALGQFVESATPAQSEAPVLEPETPAVTTATA